MRLFAVAALTACYSAPSSNPTCSVVCTESCPDGMACVNGFCVADGERCEPTFTRVHAGNGFACALDVQQRLWCWGANDQHQLDETDRQTLTYAMVVDDGPWDAISTGGDHTCGLTAGSLFCWGGNDRQQVSGTVSGDVDRPLRISAPLDEAWTHVVAGYTNTCGIAEGKLFCWGANNRAQSGVNVSPDIGTPTQVTELADWLDVSIGRDHACGISASAGLHCWGRNQAGQLGDGAMMLDNIPRLPVQVALPGATAVAASGNSTCAIAGGQLYCWGSAGRQALGDPAVAIVDPCIGYTSTPILASTLDGWTRITASRDHTCALRTNGELYCWGSTPSGLGTGVWGLTGFVKVADGVSDVSVGWNSNIDDTGNDAGDVDLTCLIRDGAVSCWGDNRFGQLAQGAATMAPTPVEIAGDHTWSQLDAGDQHMCGISDERVLCWGTNREGQLDGTGTGDNTDMPCGEGRLCTVGAPMPMPYGARADVLEVADAHTCTLDGTALTCWGTNAHLQLGPSGTTSPATIPGTWTTLYGPGGRGQCAAQDGQTYCWGSVTGHRQPLVRDSRLDGIKYIGATNTIGDLTGAGGRMSHGCVLDAQSNLACFGVDLLGQFGAGKSPQQCGNGICEIDEREGTCAADCVGKRTCSVNACGRNVCSPQCGDGSCNYGYGETCSTCAADCGVCPFVNLGRSYTALSVNWNSGSAFTCGIRSDAQIECWGRNLNGQSGALDPIMGQVIDPVYTPNIIEGLSSCSTVASGGSTACAICNGDIYCWGSNRTGAVGAGALTAFPITVPRKVDVSLDGGDRWVQLSLGEGFSCARSEQGRGFCWGLHTRGALGIGGVSANLPVPVKTPP